MVKIINDDLYDKLWKKINKDFKFNPSIKLDVIPFEFKIKVKCFKFNSFASPLESSPLPLPDKPSIAIFIIIFSLTKIIAFYFC